MVAENFDIDVLGTFTGEVERKGDPITTTRNKCITAMDAFGCDLGVATEGSFDGHPFMFFISADDKIVFLLIRRII